VCVYFSPVIGASIFSILALTDFFDGYWARRYTQVTAIGAALDPIADKFLIYSALVTLLTLQKIFFYWVIIFIGREFFVVSLRQLAGEKGLLVPVSYSAKIKTALQMGYILVALLHPLDDFFWWDVIENILLGSSLLLSLSTAGQYARLFLKKQIVRAL
jgi:CDP-diacylglycerol--glycerol-3-phosphate 3-phosphatidyltransferase